ncbi:MAG TPA: hypothetical protein DEB39_03610 [Planctomycetaceae bacterium]|nr:hypothetical protein [Planctomycetaceae bacterium]
MKKYSLICVNTGIFLLISFLLASESFAEGKLRLVRYEISPRSTKLILSVLPGQDDTRQNLSDRENDDASSLRRDTSLPDNETGDAKNEPPGVQVVDSDDDNAEDSPARHTVFRAGVLRGIIAWNGKSGDDGEEIMVVSSDEISATGKNEGVIGIIPLPGKPFFIERAKVDFAQIKSAIEQKIEEAGGLQGRATPDSVLKLSDAESHAVFVLEFSDFSDFIHDLTCFIDGLYDIDISIEIGEHEENVLKAYWKKGFRYFAFDLSPLANKPSRKAPILFHFRSTMAYYPLAINAVGGGGHALVDLVVITPESINLHGSFEEGKEETKIVLKGNTPVTFSIDELRGFEPRVADLFAGHDSVIARNFLFERKNIGDYKNDFIATHAVESGDVSPDHFGNNNNDIHASDEEIAKRVDDMTGGVFKADGIHLLFVFGTEEEKCASTVAQTKQRLELLLETTGVLSDKPFKESMKRVKIDSVHFLDGKHASPANILKICQNMDEQTGKEGVILVYIVCRDAETTGGQTLYPQAKSETDLGEGLLRQDVFDTITQHEHRLCVFITDGCANNNAQYNGGMTSSWSQEPIYMFSALLAYGKGKYNIRAASPTKQERALGTADMGAFFTNVFVNSMDRPIPDTAEFDMKSLIRELQVEMDNLYGEVNDPVNKQKHQTIMLW